MELDDDDSPYNFRFVAAKTYPSGNGWRIVDVAEYLGCSYDHARDLMVSGEIECSNITKSKRKQLRNLRTSLTAIEEYLRRNKVGQEEEQEPRRAKRKLAREAKTWKFFDPNKSGRRR